MAAPRAVGTPRLSMHAGGMVAGTGGTLLATPGGLQANARSQTHSYAFEVVKLRVLGMHCRSTWWGVTRRPVPRVVSMRGRR